MHLLDLLLDTFLRIIFFFRSNNTHNDNSTWSIGSFFCKETLCIEFKEFKPNKIYLKNVFEKNLDGNNFDQDEDDDTNKTVQKMENFFRKIIENSLYCELTQLVKDNIIQYISNYVPKYIASFGNYYDPVNHFEHGQFYIGISDNGQVFGIPNIGIDFDGITESIYQIVANLQVNSKLKTSIRANIKIEIIDVDTSDLDFLDNNLGDYIKYFQDKNYEYDTYRAGYMKKRQEWNEELSKYKKAINILMNEPHIRIDIIDFTRNYSNESIQNIDQFKTKMIKRFQDPTPFDIKIGEMTDKKSDPANIEFWIGLYKDTRSHEILVKKPPIQVMQKPPLCYSEIFKIYHPLIYPIVRSGIQMKVIKISFPTRAILDNWEKIPFVSDSILKYPVRRLDQFGNPECSSL